MQLRPVSWRFLLFGISFVHSTVFLRSSARIYPENKERSIALFAKCIRASIVLYLNKTGTHIFSSIPALTLSSLLLSSDIQM